MSAFSRLRYVMRVAAREWRETSDAALARQADMVPKIAPNGYVYMGPKETVKNVNSG